MKLCVNSAHKTLQVIPCLAILRLGLSSIRKDLRFLHDTNDMLCFDAIYCMLLDCAHTTQTACASICVPSCVVAYLSPQQAETCPAVAVKRVVVTSCGCCAYLTPAFKLTVS